jgi:hypothetical protein
MTKPCVACYVMKVIFFMTDDEKPTSSTQNCRCYFSFLQSYLTLCPQGREPLPQTLEDSFRLVDPLIL